LQILILFLKKLYLVKLKRIQTALFDQIYLSGLINFQHVAFFLLKPTIFLVKLAFIKYPINEYPLMVIYLSKDSPLAALYENL